MTWKWSAEAIQLQHPGLSLAQAHSALVYYYDHQPEIDRQITDSEQESLEYRRRTENPKLQAELRQKFARGTTQP